MVFVVGLVVGAFLGWKFGPQVEAKVREKFGK